MTTLVREDVAEARAYAFSVVPFRCLMVATHPAENNVIRVESIEPWATCPDGWHESPVFYASGEAPPHVET
jgi:hypothetical protein